MRLASWIAAIILASLGEAGAQQPTAPPGPNNLVLSCTGAFAPDTDIQRVRQVFGDANVQNETFYIGEGAFHTETAIFPHDPIRRIEILWQDEDRQAKPSLIQVPLLSSRVSLWRGPGNIHIGASLAEVERLNGAPFELDGFDDVGRGQVLQWNGALQHAFEATECHDFRISFSPDPGAPDQSLQAVNNQEPFSSDDPDIQAVRPRISEMFILFSRD